MRFGGDVVGVVSPLTLCSVLPIKVRHERLELKLQQNCSPHLGVLEATYNALLTECSTRVTRMGRNTY